MAVNKKIISLFLMLLWLVLLTACSSFNFFSKWDSEGESVPYAEYYLLHYKNNQIDVQKSIDKYFGTEKYSVKELLVIKNSRVYFIYSTVIKDSDSNTYAWNIASLNLYNLEDVQIHYSDCFISSINYLRSFTNDSSERCGFYHDGNIVLTDFKNLVEYNITSGVTTEYKYDEYEYPEIKYQYEINDDNKKIIIKNVTGTFQKEISIDDMERSKYGKDLIKLRDKNVLGGASRLDDFFDNVMFIGGKVYLINVAYDILGDSFVVIYEYNVEEDKYYYIDSTFFGDRLNNDFYLVEEVKVDRGNYETKAP